MSAPKKQSDENPTQKTNEDAIQLIEFIKDFDIENEVDFRFVRIVKFYKKYSLLLLVDINGTLIYIDYQSGNIRKKPLHTEEYGYVEEIELSSNSEYLLIKYKNSLCFYSMSPFEVD